MKHSRTLLPYLPGTVQVVSILYMVIVPTRANCIDCGMARGIILTSTSVVMLALGILAAVLVPYRWKSILAFNTLPTLLALAFTFLTARLSVSGESAAVPVQASGLSDSEKLFLCSDGHSFGSLSLNDTWVDIRFPAGAWENLAICTKSPSTAQCSSFLALDQQANAAGLQRNERSLLVSIQAAGVISIDLSRKFSVQSAAKVRPADLGGTPTEFASVCGAPR